MKASQNIILITGGATGIGFGLAERFIKESNTVIICGRRESVLNEASKKIPSLISRICDLSVPREREDLFKWISEEHNDLNILVNNAGIQQGISITDDDFLMRTKDEIAINVEAPIHLASLFIRLKSLRTIINVTSGLAFAPIARMPVYCASKAFMHSYTLSLRHLVKASGIEVIELIPPALNTDLGGKGRHNDAPPVNAFVEAVFEQLKQGKTTISFGFSEGMAKAGPDDLQRAFDRMNK